MRPRRLQNSLSPYAFTRIELLATFCLFVILFTLVIPSSPVGGREAARRGKAASAARAIVNATSAYFSDYDTCPKVTSPRTPQESFIFVGDTGAGATQSNAALFDVLRAIPRGTNADHALNKRQSKYFEWGLAHDPKGPRDGFTDGPKFSADLQGRLYDPWGYEYCVVMETDRDGLLNLGPIYFDLGTPDASIKAKCAAFSLSKDGARGDKSNPNRFRTEKGYHDDLASWE